MFSERLMFFRIRVFPPFILMILLIVQNGFVYAQDNLIIELNGIVSNAKTKAVIVGASVSILGDKSSFVLTDSKGKFSIRTKKREGKLLVTYVGYTAKNIPFDGKKGDFRIDLEEVSHEIEDVVITGMFDRKKESFTGSAATVTGEQLRTIGNQNVIQSLRSLDPSFILVDNNLMGSDPNSLARIELRGKTSVSNNSNLGVLTDQIGLDPNMPLFILDGFESSLRQITDLDINRVASITILKDAASTALYGARSANGVIVVETIKPKAGELIVNYSGDFSASMADLRDYNLMNAEESLEFERLAGRYNGNSLQYDYVAQQEFYNQRLANVRKGVNSYWLVEPLRDLAINNGHSINVSGGSNEFQYGVSGNIQNIQGVMIGSDRRNMGGSVDLLYRKNKLNITNRTFVSGGHSMNSPYGEFSTYAGMKPYYKKGNLDKYLETLPMGGGNIGYDPVYIHNPLYNASLNSDNKQTSFSIQNNLGFNYDINSSLRLTGGFQVTKGLNELMTFVSPLDTRFDNTTLLEKGEYSQTNNTSQSYNGNLSVAYSKVFLDDHILTFNTRAELQESTSKSLGLEAVGFPIGVKGNPSFAFSYKPNSKPSAFIMPKIRRVNFLASLNYIYKNKYYMDATYRIDGSTAFGSNKRYSPFWSTGLGWNVHKEEYIQNSADWLSTLILKANIGVTGNQSFGSFMSTTVYNLESITNYFNQGYYHTSLGNPNLEWQKTTQSNISLDLGVFKNRLTTSFSVYRKFTDPLIVNMLLPSSNGVSHFSMNLGTLTVDGLEANIKYSPIMNTEKRFVWTIGLLGSMYKSSYGDMGEEFDRLNEEQKKSNSIQRFLNGGSPDDMWAVKSLGIDLSSGKEVFLKKDGTYTVDYDYSDLRKVGNSRPFSEGVISSSIRLNAFTFNLYLRYNLKSYRFNNALYEKVENISFEDLAYNQDKRALELRWRNPGDISQFKGISLTDETQISSRFIQKENFLSGESISMGYDMYSADSKLLRSAKLKSLRFNAYMNNIFRISNILSERGIEYPFANSVSLSVKASF